jgi:hypothetical protein
MLVAELVKSCSNPNVADAALASIGPDFRRQVERAAIRAGMDAGRFAARCVEEFGREGNGLRRAAVIRAMERQDMPLLSGLRRILEMRIDEERARTRDFPSRAMAFEKLMSLATYADAGLRSQGRVPAGASARELG